MVVDEVFRLDVDRSHMSSPEKIQCPKCGSRKLARIVYGYPRLPLRLYSITGRVVLAGCMVGADSPTSYCRNCGTTFGRIKNTSKIR